MKKQVKMLSIILVIMMVIASMSSVVLAVEGGAVLNNIKNSAVDSANKDTAQITSMGGRIVVIMQTVGIVVAVVVLLILGIKYMMGSAEEKADYKKSMIPYLVGAILIFAATTIVNVVYQIANGLNA